jgi:outer membrane protein assembly factor BamB
VKVLIRILLVLALALALVGCQTVGGWFRGDKTQEPPAELVDFESTVNVNQLWSTNAGAGLSRSRPNFRPHHDNGLIWVGDYRGRIVAVDAERGRVTRRFDSGLDLSAGPSVQDGVLLAGTFDGVLVAMDPENGSTRWRAQLSSEILSYPVLHDGVVVARSIDGRTFGFDVNDGSRLWVYDRGVPLLTLRGNSDPLTRAGRAYIGHDDGMVSALRVSDGSVLWEQRVSMTEGRTELDRLADIDGPMAIVGSELYVVTYRGRLASLALESGRILWVRDIASSSGLAVQRTQLAVTDQNDKVQVLDRRNGTTEWENNQMARRGLTRPEFVGDHLVTIDEDGYMHWINIRDGRFAARTRIGRNTPAEAPLVVGNVVYVLDEDGSLSAWRARN